MSSTTETRTLVEEIVDNADERELWIVGREFERPPYFHAGKGGDTRLARALRVCVEGRITPNSDGSYSVEGSEHRSYRVADSCSCPQSQKATSKWCYHAVAVALYVEWQRRLRPIAPVVLGTLRPGTLPLTPTTVDERLARTMEAIDTMNDAAAAVRLSVYDAPASRTHHTPCGALGDVMPDDEYILEPDNKGTPTATVEPPAQLPAPRHLPGPVLLPSLDAQSLERSMQAYAAQRQVVTRYIKEQMSEGVDYYTLTIKGRVTKATLSKAGSEKFLSLFQLSAQFQQDEATWRMLGSKDGLLCYTCHLLTRSGEVVGEGRGARNVAQDGGDINKAIKMACKSSQVDAVLRTGALSDVFTQDMEPEGTPEPPMTHAAKSTSQELRQRIWTMIQAQAPHVTTREAVEAWIQERTGYALHPDFYRDILTSLERSA